jgi:hypothetical protein
MHRDAEDRMNERDKRGVALKPLLFFVHISWSVVLKRNAVLAGKIAFLV